MKPRVFLPAILSGLLLWAAFFPLDLGPVAAVALVPWLTLVRAEGVAPRRRYLAAYAGGLAFYLPALQWIRVAHPAMYGSWIGLSLYCSLYHVLALYLLRRLDRLGRPPLALTLPVVWVALEYCRAHFPTGFPFLRHIGAYQLVGFGWYFLGHPLHSIAPLRQAADLGGVYVLTVLVAAVNGVVFDWADRFGGVRRLLRRPTEFRHGLYREMWEAAGATALLLGLVLYGTWRLQHPAFETGPRVSAIQADIEQDAKMDDVEGLFQRYDHLCRTAPHADLVVWPETCYPFSLNLLAPGTAPAGVDAEFLRSVRVSQLSLRQDAANWKTNVLLGLNVNEWDAGVKWKYNSAVLIEPGAPPGARYDKMHLVPFGEYVPFRGTLPWLQAFTPYSGDYSCRPGESYTRFPLHVGDKTYTFGCLICYEDSDPYLARQYAREDGVADPVDFLVNISNDGWFRGTEEHEQHLAICRFRAVEARRAVVRAVNMGISAIIDGDGGVAALPGDSWAESKRMDGTVTARIPLDRRRSFYARVGDWLPAACWALVAVGVVATRRRRGPNNG